MNTETPLVYTARFKVKGHDVNSEKYITIPSLIRKMQECSLQHARNLKTSVWDMTEDAISWVLIRNQLKIIDHPKLDDEITIITYPSGFDKFFAFRDFLVFDADKKLIAGASSTWTIIDLNTRKLTKIPEKIINIGTPKNLKFLAHADKILKLTSILEQVDERSVRPYDLDWNNHVNNIVLSRFLLESSKSLGIEDHHISKLLFHFKNEVNLGDSISVMSGKDEESITTVLKNKAKDQVIAAAKVNLRSDLMR